MREWVPFWVRFRGYGFISLLPFHVYMGTAILYGWMG